ncbi:hypothetical protein KR222_008491, partial [Zaprionus bogoriensis]
TDVYNISVPGIEPFPVYCDSSLAGNGWTVIQRRKDGSVNFNRNWAEYREGFGDLRGEFFIGLEKLHLLTKSQVHELYIYMNDAKSSYKYALYNEFRIGDETDQYRIMSLGVFSGNSINAMFYHNQKKFSTPDMDNDMSPNNCAKTYNSGWWFDKCFYR